MAKTMLPRPRFRPAHERLCEIARRSAYFSLCGLVCSSVLIWLSVGAAMLFGGIFLCFFLFWMTAWTVLSAVFYARFTLGGLLGAVCSVGTFVALAVAAPLAWKPYAATAAIGLSMLFVFYIVLQDPCWARFRPSFLPPPREAANEPNSGDRGE